MPDVADLDLFAHEDLPLPPTFWDDYHGRPAAAAADMRIDDMFLAQDMKLHEQAYGEETGTGGSAGANLPFSMERVWEWSYRRLTPEQRQAWDAHYGPINAAFAESRPEGHELSEWKYQRYIKDYLRCVASVDANLGRVLDYLDQNGLTENTLVVYTSDQGFYLGEHGWYDKRFMYEESLGTPLLVRYPRAIPAGQVSEALVLNLDFAPTLLDYAGVKVPEEMQGRSFRALAAGEMPGDWRRDFYYRYYEFPHGWHSVRPHYGIRTERYKLIYFEADMDHWELFDLQADPRELNDLYERDGFEELKLSLHARLEALRNELGDSDPAETAAAPGE
jgi:arylsulfatase A-like enzyme